MKQPLTITYSIVNLNQEKERFFANQAYNPQFEYEHPPLEEYLTRYGELDDSIVTTADSILEKALKKYHNPEGLLAAEGPLVTEAEAKNTITQYLQSNGIQTKVSVFYSPTMVARTAVNQEQKHCHLKVRLPISYHQRSLKAMLDHEVGTHIFRWLNEFEQPWYNHHPEYQLIDHVETEEGLATLHTHLTHPVPFLWQPALYVKAISFAQTNSFAKVYELLRPYVTDHNQRWLLTVRVKRGLIDTSQRGGYKKDMLYLQGAKKVARYLTDTGFNAEPLYLGKVALEDINRLQKGYHHSPNMTPLFIHDPNYRTALSAIIQANNLL